MPFFSRAVSTRVSSTLRPLSRLATAGALLASLGLQGCFHYHTHVPGVLDLREPTGPMPHVAGTADPSVSRTGFDGLVKGDGYQPIGDTFVVKDRNYWVLGLFSVSQQDVTPPLAYAMKSGGGLRDVHIGDGQAGTDVGITWAVELVGDIVWPVLLLEWVLPSMTFEVSGTQVQTGAPPAVAANGNPQ